MVPGGVYELSSESTGIPIDQLRILKPTDELWAVSPDRHYLAYEDDQEVMSYDLDTKESKNLFKVPDQITCLTWSLDNSMLNYVSGHNAYIYQISKDVTTEIYKAPSARYSNDPIQLQLGMGGELHYGQVACGDWFGVDRMLFRRFAGVMPSSVNGDAELRPNVTTLAVVGDTLDLSNVIPRVNIIDVSTDGKFFLINVFENEEMHISHTYMTTAFTDINAVKDLDSIDAREISLSPDYLEIFLRFVPYSHDLFLFDEHQIYFIDPASLQPQPGPKFDLTWIAWTWIGNPKDNVYAAIVAADGWTNLDVILVDLDTGGRTLLMQVPNYNGSSSANLIWLPPK